MARNAGGTYSLPAGNPVVTGTVIASSWANTTLSDIAAEMTDSLDRSGKGGMLAPLLLADGAVGTPGLAFTSEPSTGIYRAAANDLRVGVAGVDAIRLTTAAAAPRIIFTSPQAGAGAQTDFVFNTTNARTAGNIFDVQNNGASRLTISNTGVVTAALGFIVTAGGLTVTAGGLTVTAGGLTVSAGGITSTGQTLTVSDLAAASALTDITLRTLNTRTAGKLLDVQNNVTSVFNVAFDGTFQHISSTAAAGTGTDFFFNTTARTAGLIFDVQRSAQSVFNIGPNGQATFFGRQATGAATTDFVVNPQVSRNGLVPIFDILNAGTLLARTMGDGSVSLSNTNVTGNTTTIPARYTIISDVSAAVVGTYVNVGPSISISLGFYPLRLTAKLWVNHSVGTMNTNIKVNFTGTGNVFYTVMGANANSIPSAVAIVSTAVFGSGISPGTAAPAGQSTLFVLDVLVWGVSATGTLTFSFSPSAAGTSTIKAYSWWDIGFGGPL